MENIKKQILSLVLLLSLTISLIPIITTMENLKVAAESTEQRGEILILSLDKNSVKYDETTALYHVDSKITEDYQYGEKYSLPENGSRTPYYQIFHDEYGNKLEMIELENEYYSGYSSNMQAFTWGIMPHYYATRDTSGNIIDGNKQGYWELTDVGTTPQSAINSTVKHELLKGGSVIGSINNSDSITVDKKKEVSVSYPDEYEDAIYTAYEELIDEAFIGSDYSYRSTFSIPTEVEEALAAGKNVYMLPYSDSQAQGGATVEIKANGKEIVFENKNLVERMGYSTELGSVYDVLFKDTPGEVDGIKSNNFVKVNGYWTQFVARDSSGNWLGHVSYGTLSGQTTKAGNGGTPKTDWFGRSNVSNNGSDIKTYIPYGGIFGSVAATKSGNNDMKGIYVRPDYEWHNEVSLGTRLDIAGTKVSSAYLYSDSTAIHTVYTYGVRWFIAADEEPTAIIIVTDENDIPVDIETGEPTDDLDKSSKRIEKDKIKVQNGYWDVNWDIECPDWGSSIMEVYSVENPTSIKGGLSISPEDKSKYLTKFKPGDGKQLDKEKRTDEKSTNDGGELEQPCKKYDEEIADMSTINNEQEPCYENDTTKTGSKKNHFYSYKHTDSVIYYIKIKKSEDTDLGGIAYTFKDEDGNYVDSSGNPVNSPQYTYINDVVKDEQSGKTYWDVNWDIKCPDWGLSIKAVESFENRINSQYEERAGKTVENSLTLGWQLNIETNPISVDNAVMSYEEKSAVPKGDNSLMKADNIKTGSDKNYYYDLDETDSIVYEVTIIKSKAPENTESTGDLTLYQNQISRKEINYDLGIELVTSRPTWVDAIGTHHMEYSICRLIDIWTGVSYITREECESYASDCRLHHLISPVYNVSWWADAGSINDKVIAGKNTSLSYGFGLYVKHNENSTGNKNYSLSGWTPDTVAPTVDFVLWRKENLPTIASYKNQTLNAMVTSSDGLSLKKGKVPETVAENQDYVRTTLFDFSQTDIRTYKVGSHDYGNDIMNVIADCEALSGHWGGEWTHTSLTHVGRMQTNEGANTTDVNVKVYSGGADKNVSAIGSAQVSTANLNIAGRDIKVIVDGQPQNIGGLTKFSYYPYVKMSYESLTVAKTDIYVLSRYKSTYTPNNYIEFGYTSGKNEEDDGEGKESIKLTSQLFSTHWREMIYKVTNILNNIMLIFFRFCGIMEK